MKGIIKNHGSIIREQEIEQYGRSLSLRPSVAHKTKNKYTCKLKHKNNG